MLKPFVHIAVAAALFTPATAYGCIPPLVEFTFGSSQLPPEGRYEVSLVLRKAQAVPDAKVKLMATTDGSRANREMSGRRVQAIKAVLMRGGVPESRIDVEYVMATSDGSARLILMEVVSAPTCGD